MVLWNLFSFFMFKFDYDKPNKVSEAFEGHTTKAIQGHPVFDVPKTR